MTQAFAPLTSVKRGGNDWWRSAQVAELVDALASGASGLMVVEVRVFSWAPFSFDACSRTFRETHFKP